MPKINNPFKPTQPVYRGMFAGRVNEIDRIETILLETRNGNPTNLLIIGERGIGKTSLLLFTKYLAEGGISINDGHLDFMTIFVSLDKRTSVGVLAQKMKTATVRQFRDSKDAFQVLKDVWSFIQRIEVCGTKIRDKSTYVAGEAEIFENFTYSIVDTVKAITSKENAISKLGFTKPKDGLVIFIDEADNAPEELDLGTLIKQLSEKLVADNCNNVLIVLAGLPDICKGLTASHGSALRLFEELELFPLSHNDVKRVIHLGLEEANIKNSDKVEITEKALDLIVMFSEGYPHFVQQFGYSSYAFDKDNLIDDEDVQTAAFSVGGAFDLIGDRYYKDMYFNKIKKDSYRQVLKIMSVKWNEWISKKYIRSHFEGKDTTLDNALMALASRNLILKKPGARGIYRLQWVGFAFWIKLFAKQLEKRISSYNSSMTTINTK
jgi:hypothetical protein